MFNYLAAQNALKVENHDMWIFSSLLQESFLNELIKAFPQQSYVRKIEQKTNPNYDTIRYDNLDYLDAGHPSTFGDKNISDIWKSFYNELNSKKYLSIIENLTGEDLSDVDIHLWFMRYHDQGYLSKHYDRQPNKVLTQVFYFNDLWTSDNGGYFNLLTSSPSNNIIYSMIPNKIHSVLIKCNESAWHEVSPVKNTKEARCSVNIEYIKRT